MSNQEIIERFEILHSIERELAAEFAFRWVSNRTKSTAANLTLAQDRLRLAGERLNDGKSQFGRKGGA